MTQLAADRERNCKYLIKHTYARTACNLGASPGISLLAMSNDLSDPVKVSRDLIDQRRELLAKGRALVAQRREILSVLQTAKRTGDRRWVGFVDPGRAIATPDQDVEADEARPPRADTTA